MGIGTNHDFQGGDAADSVVEGTASDDLLFGSDGSDQIYGYAGDDQLIGEAGDDMIWGGDGKDYLSGRNGDDTLYGQGGDDFIGGDGGKDILFGGDGTDRMWGGDGNDEISGGNGEDYLDGGNGSDVLRGGVGSDQLNGRTGLDSLIGGADNDYFDVDGLDRLYDGGSGEFDSLHFTYSDSPALTIDLSLTTAQFIRADAVQGLIIRGIEMITASAYADSLIGNSAKNQLDGAAGDDSLNGGGGDDQLLGGTGDDTLVGGSGADRLSGDEGRDTLSGGGGEDTFFITRKLPSESATADTILDFNTTQDTIYLARSAEGIDFALLGNGGPISASHFVANASGTAQDADDFLVYNTSNGELWYDPNGSGSGKAELIAIIGVSSHPALTVADFDML